MPSSLIRSSSSAVSSIRTLTLEDIHRSKSLGKIIHNKVQEGGDHVDRHSFVHRSPEKSTASENQRNCSWVRNNSELSRGMASSFPTPPPQRNTPRPRPTFVTTLGHIYLYVQSEQLVAGHGPGVCCKCVICMGTAIALSFLLKTYSAHAVLLYFLQKWMSF